MWPRCLSVWLLNALEFKCSSFFDSTLSQTVCTVLQKVYLAESLMNEDWFHSSAKMVHSAHILLNHTIPTIMSCKGMLIDSS